MATKNFKGFQLVALATFNGADFTKDKDTLYFVRTSGDKRSGTDGFLYFNGKKYGTAEDAKAALITKYGNLKVTTESGEKDATIAEYVAAEIAKVNGAAATLAGRVTTNEEAIKTINGKIDIINGEDGVEGSIKKALADAKAYTDGVKTDIVGTEDAAGTIKHAEKLANDAATAVTTEKERAEGVEAQLRIDVDAKVKSVEGTDTVVATTTEHAVSVSLKTSDKGNVKFTQDTDGLSANVTIPAATVTGVKADDKFLSLTDKLVGADVSIDYDADDKKIYLYGKDKTKANAVSSIDCRDFIKDGMLDGSALYTATAATGTVTINTKEYNLTGLTAKHTYIVLVWNTDAAKDAMAIDVTSLIDTYTAGNGLSLNGHEFSVNTEKIATKASVDTVTGRVTTLEGKVGSAATEGSTATGLFKAIADEAATARKAEKANADAITKLNATHANDGENFKTVAAEVLEGIAGIAEASKASAEGEADVKVTVTTKSGSVTAVAVDSSELARKVTANDTAIKTEAQTARAAEKANAAAISALDKKITDGAVTLEVNDNDKYLGVSSATTTDKGIVYTLASKADAIDTAIQNAVNGKNVAAEGESGETALVSASAEGNKVTVATTQKLQNAVAKAETSVQSVNGKASSAVTLTGNDIATNQNVGGSKTATVNAVLADIYTKLGLVVKADDATIKEADDHTLSVNLETMTDGTVAAGHVALEHGTDGALYGVMYYSGDDAE